MKLWVMYYLGLLTAAVAPWTSPQLPIAGKLGIDTAVLIVGAGFAGAVRAGGS